jgi:carbamoyltransferase
MVFVCEVQENKQAVIPAVTHVDQTARPQTVSKEQNLIFAQLLEKLAENNHAPVVLNTSFNVNGEPLVCSPEDAVKIFLYAKLDCLVLGSFIVERSF